MSMLRLPGAAALLAALILIASGCEDRRTPPRGASAADATDVDGERAALPEGAEALSLLGRPLHPPTLTEELRLGREARLEEARAALEAAPEDAEALVWMGRRLAYLGRYGDAVEVYTRALALHPDDPRLYRHRGHRFITLRRLDEAVADLRRAAELVEGREDQVEPDGLPNERGIPTSTLHFNIWYHLGLAHYLKGELEQALLAFNSALEVSRHPDSVVASTYWIVNILRRLGLEERAEAALEVVESDLDIIESGAYLDVLLLHRGQRTPEQIMGSEDALTSATTAYGVGNWHHVEGRRERAFQVWEETLEAEDQWAAFGYLAAEAELARVQGAG